MVSVKKSSIFSSVFFSKIGLEIMLSYGQERHIVFISSTELSTFKVYFLLILSQPRSKTSVIRPFNLFASQLMSQTLSSSVNVPFKQSAIQLN